MALHTIVLLRHGEYDAREDGTFELTERGRRQAEQSGKLLALGHFDRVYASSLVRARQTAEIVCSALGKPFTTSPMLAEGMPTRLKSTRLSAREVQQDLARLERAYERHFRPSVRQRTDLIVCHANVIRYFVTRVMGVRARAWARLVANHCAVTRVLVLPTGATRLLSYNETAHLPIEMLT